MKKTQADLLQGTLYLLALKTLQSGPTQGRDIAQRVRQVSQDVLRMGQGALCPARRRLEAQGWIAEAFYRGGGTDSENVLNGQKGRILPCSTS
jgi:DNA-binding PadR family transcriptional regulator